MRTRTAATTRTLTVSGRSSSSVTPRPYVPVSAIRPLPKSIRPPRPRPYTFGKHPAPPRTQQFWDRNLAGT
ncbi:hypothetical protein BDY21DRAFT_338845 [Lineolata rhizophorae]|uniref:Uncharacterized protein n=1 Tax=Lineolata rhizophorae TaxID=578093 RepID=A0A6A6P878_9PEZI|nr:hypothetical protein BDY21DRAFT_338845 [Lineolata rhizophorae]